MNGATARDGLDLSGEWRLRLDANDEGLTAHWAASPLSKPDRIILPNTTDLAGYGFALDTNVMLHAAPFPVTTRFPGVKEPFRADEHGYLVRRHLFVGPAWYEREIEIPPGWEGRPVTLRIERALWRTEVWVDGRRVGDCDSLAAEHRYELGKLSPGGHRLTIRVDNRMIHNLSTVTHAYGPETQSRWNGLIGQLRLEATPPVSIRRLIPFPAKDRGSVRAVVKVWNAGAAPVLKTATLRIYEEKGNAAVGEARAEWSCAPGESTHECTVPLSGAAAAWDEFCPVRYRWETTLGEQEESSDKCSIPFGFRHVEREGRKLLLNGRRLFLRGTLDCAVYPKTGHPPMTVDEWGKVLGVVKGYGFNHVRFHTWCPPEAAFEAADQLGVYLQPEAAAWVDDWGTQTVTRPASIGRDPEVMAFLRSELLRMSEAYGHHPSFLLCAIGNEFGMQGTDWERVNALVEEIKRVDPRRLYAGCGARKLLTADDFWFTHHTGAGTRGVGPAHTDWDFAPAAAASSVPLLAHETGQRPVFPDYAKLLPKFVGPLVPLNLERYRRGLEASGLGGRTLDFVRASARFQLVQYKAEHEAMLRTREYSGYQLLMLNDFTGQSEALVGMLDPFWESKGIVGADDVRAWNHSTVLLARFPKFVWTAGETFRARVEISHFGPADLVAARATWSITQKSGEWLARGELEPRPVVVGGLTDLGEIEVRLEASPSARAVTLRVQRGEIENRWNLWIYPTGAVEPEPPGVRVTRSLDAQTLTALEKGGRVLLLAHGLKNPQAARTGFESVYWSAGWWGNRFSSLGVWCDPQHSALREFPNDGHSDWQWRELTEGATTFDLTGAPAGFRPIVQPVPDFHFNTLLGQVFEAKVGKGSLLVCGYDLTERLEERPAARQFRRCLFRYVAGEAFRPEQELPLDWVMRRFGSGDLPSASGATAAPD